MQKTARVLYSLAFSVGCFGLWLVLGLFEGICRARFHPWTELPELTQLFMRDSWWLLCVPVPFLAFSLWNCFQAKQRMEFTLLLLGLLVAVFAVMFFSVAVAIVLPWLPHS